MELRYDEIDGDILIIKADGGINAKAADELIDQVAALVDAGLRKIIVDCGDVTWVSSYGLGVLVQLHKRMRARGGDVKLAAVRGVLAEVLQLTRLSHVFALYHDVNRARLEFRPRGLHPAASSPG